MSMLTQLASCFLVSVKTLCTLTTANTVTVSIFLHVTDEFRHFPTDKKKENKQPRMDEMSDLKSLPDSVRQPGAEFRATFCAPLLLELFS